MPSYAVGDRVKCLATRFDEGSEDSQGRTFSQRHLLKEQSSWVVGTVRRVLRGDKYKVLWDGDSRQYTSHESHLEAWNEEEFLANVERGPNYYVAWRTVPDHELSDSEDEGPPASDHWDVVEPTREDSDGEPDNELVDVAGDDNGEVEVHGIKWLKKDTMGEDARGSKPRAGFQFRNLVVNEGTTRYDMWKELFPVQFKDMADIVAARARQKNDNGFFDEDGLRKFLACLYAGSQFRVGTDVWAKEKKGLMPPPNFCKYMSQDKFNRWMRYISMGRPQDDGNEDPWYEVRWLVDKLKCKSAGNMSTKLAGGRRREHMGVEGSRNATSILCATQAEGIGGRNEKPM